MRKQRIDEYVFLEDMREVKSVLFSTICLMTVTNALPQSELRPTSNKTLLNETQCLDLYSGVRLYVNGRQIWINVRILDLFEENAVKARKSSSDDEQTKEPTPLKKFGFMVMMAPFAMQLISLPGTLASIKMSLLRSIFVAKLAIIMMIYNLIKNIQPTEVVVYQQPEHHEHYYSGYQEAENDNEAWFGR